MALTVGVAPEPTRVRVRRVSARHFVRLKLRVMANGFRGQSWRIVLFIIAGIVGLWFAAAGFLLMALPGWSDNPDLDVIIPGLGGGLLVLGWTLLPLVFFGVDETIDPARFALLPLPRRTLVTGLLAAALVGIPAIAVLVATSGLVLASWLRGGPVAGLVAAIGVVGGLLLCVAVSRAVTSAFATALRSRRVRDLAAILLAVLAALLGPVQTLAISAAKGAEWHRLAGLARVVGWTPFGAPYTIGLDVAQGRAWAVPVKLLITALSIVVLLWWWSRSLESAMVGAVSGGAAGRRGRARENESGVVARLFPRMLWWIRRDRFGAVVAREARYWWRDTRRRASLISLAVVGVFVPATMNLSTQRALTGHGGFDPSAALLSVSMIFVGVLAAVALANQFGFDGTAYAANVIAGVPGRVELRARVTAYALYTAPLLLLITVLLAVFLGEPGWIGVMAGNVFGAYGAGVTINLFVSVLGAYALPETSNPFAMNSGGGTAKSALSLLSMIGSAVVSIPLMVATALLGEVWLWIALPVGLAYGIAAVLLGTYIAGDVLDRRMPELLVAVTPRR